jgi:predicted nuclease of predicted toxin-antitoxin system
MAAALASDRILLTEDKDFGQLVYAHRLASRGVILIRFPAHARSQLGATVVEAVEQAGERLAESFTVIQPGRVRMSRDPNL